MVHYCEFCKNSVNLNDCVVFSIKYQVVGTTDIAEFYVYIHESCFTDPKFKGRADVFREHAELVK